MRALPDPNQGVPVGTIKRNATGKGNASKAEVIVAVKTVSLVVSGETP